MSDLYLFHFDVTSYDKSGYYYTNWHNAVPVSVVASNEDEARRKAFALRGTPRDGYGWIARLTSITPAPTNETGES